MKFLIVLSMSALMVLSGCAVRLHGSGHGHYRFRSGHGHGHFRHHRRHHWNAPGPAYSEAKHIKEITILPASLPKEIDGEVSDAQEAQWRSEWPMQAAKLVAASLSSGTDSAVTATASESKPSSGYYMTLDILYLDVGDPNTNTDGTPKERGSAMAAHGMIVNAGSGQVVADVKFTESSGWTGDIQFDKYMGNVGSSLSDWFVDQRKK